MKGWIISANNKYYDYHRAFADLDLIDWIDNNRNFSREDIVYIYSSKPIGKIEYKCEVVATNIKYENTIDDKKYWIDASKSNNREMTYVRLKKIDQFDTELFSYKNLINNGMKIAPRSPITLTRELEQYISNVEASLVRNDSMPHKKKFLLVDHGSGSYNIENKGHELFNETLNPIDQKYYAYVPPHSTLNITNLGADKKDDFIDDIMVLFVTKPNPKSTNRLITGMYPSARVYKKPITQEKIQRTFKDKDGSLKTAPYSIESDFYLPLEHLSLIIKTREFNNYLFRGQRVYSGTNNKLDELIYYYIELIFNENDIGDDQEFQQRISASHFATDEDIKTAPNKKIEWVVTASGKKVKRNSSLAKSALARVHNSCEINSDHKTFLNINNEQYMEGHHLIPITLNNANYFETQFNRSIDCLENIVSLCPNCHKAIHLGNKDTKRDIIEILFYKRQQRLKDIGIFITLKDLLRLYNI